MKEIRIYGDIGGDAEDAVTSKWFLEQLDECIGEKEITLRINSQGGSVVQGLAMANAIDKHPATFHTVVEGGACSMAGYLACKGETRTIEPNSMLHIHGPMIATEGFLEDHEDSVEQLRVARDAMSGLYAELSGRTIEEVQADLNRDRFYDAKTAVALGYMTHVGEENRVAARIDAKKFPSLPKRFAASLVAKSTEPETKSENTMPKETKASIKEMKAAFKSADSDFLVSQDEIDADMKTATANYISHLEGTTAKLKAANADLKTQMEAMDPEAMEEESLEDMVARLTAENAELQAMIDGGSAMDDEEDMYMMDDDEATAMDDEATAMDGADEMKAMRATIAALQAKIGTAKGKRKKKVKGKGKYQIGARAVNASRRNGRQVARKTAKAELGERAKALIAESPNLRLVDAKRKALKSDPKLRERLNAEAN